MSCLRYTFFLDLGRMCGSNLYCVQELDAPLTKKWNNFEGFVEVFGLLLDYEKIFMFKKVRAQNIMCDILHNSIFEK